MRLAGQRRLMQATALQQPAQHQQHSDSEQSTGPGQRNGCDRRSCPAIGLESLERDIAGQQLEPQQAAPKQAPCT